MKQEYDFSGSFGMLVDDLFRGWIKARQAAKMDWEETAKLLVAWMEDDPYGFCHDLDREAVKVLDKMGGLEAFVSQIIAKFESALTDGDEEKRFPGYVRRKWGGALKTLLAAQRNVDAYAYYNRSRPHMSLGPGILSPPVQLPAR